MGFLQRLAVLQHVLCAGKFSSHSDYVVTKFSFNPFKQINHYYVACVNTKCCVSRRDILMFNAQLPQDICNALNIHKFSPSPIFHLRMSISFMCNDLFLMSELQHHNPQVDFPCKQLLNFHNLTGLSSK